MDVEEKLVKMTGQPSPYLKKILKTQCGSHNPWI